MFSNEIISNLGRRSTSTDVFLDYKKSSFSRTKSHRSYHESQVDKKHAHRYHSHRYDNFHQHYHHSNQNTGTQQSKRTYPVVTKDWLHIRSYFDDLNPYIMDAKKMGNVGRYFNHSCNPNVFVQNVFIDTHDPRFPEVAFFAKR